MRRLHSDRPINRILKAVARVGGVNTVEVTSGMMCPRVLRCDYGTENGSLAATQIALRSDHLDSLGGSKAFMYGPSTGIILQIHGCATIYAWY